MTDRDRFDATVAALRAASEQREVHRRQRELLRKYSRRLVYLTISATAFQFLWAQFLAWGLSGFGVHVGIWAPFWVLEAVGSLIATSVGIGVISSTRTIREIDHT